MTTKRTYVFQGYDGKIYGTPQARTPQANGRVNAQNRKDGVQGSWVLQEALTAKELAMTAAPDDLCGFRAPCRYCDGTGWEK
jgi:hypothetical protein